MGWTPKVIDEYGGIDYRRYDYVRHQHHLRYKRHVETKGNGFVCQECGGSGGEIEVVIPETGQGPWYDCGFCEGTGLVTRWMRGWWLRWKREEKGRVDVRLQARLASANAKRAVTPAASAAQD